MVGVVDEAMNEDKPTWAGFFAWPLVAAALAASILGMLTIGRYVLPFALLGLLAVLKWGGNRRSSIGIISGAGLPFLFVAYLHRRGPRSLCQPYGSGESCTIEKGPWLYSIVGMALVVTGVVLFIRLRRKVSSTPVPLHAEELTARVPTPHPLDQPININVGKRVAVGAAIWTILGSVVAISGLATLNRDARPFFFATILFATLAGIGATFSALRGKRRATILLLFASAIYPTYFFWVVSIIPVALACYLLISPFAASFFKIDLRRRNIQFLSFLIIAMIALVVWLEFHVDSMAWTESKGVQQAFQQMSTAVTNKEGVPTPWLVPMHAGVESYPDGAKASLWVPLPSPQGIRSSCFYVDQPSKGGASGFYNSACSVPKSEVILERQGPIVVGYVRMTKAHFATINSGGITVDAPITFGYFIFPSVVSEDLKAKFTISFIDPGGATCKVVNLPAPGTSASIECVIA